MKNIFDNTIETLGVICAIAFVLLAFTMDARAENRPVTRPVLPTPLEGYEVANGWEWFPSQPHLLFFVGSITAPEGNVNKQKVTLEAMLGAHPEIAIVVLHSGGGSVATGALMAQIIHEHELFTYVPKDAECSSACGFMWLAGKQRILDGKLGAHQVSLGHEGDNMPTTLGAAYGEVQSFLGNLMGWMYEYDVPTLYYAWMLLTPASDMHFFTPEEEAVIVTGEDTPHYDHVDNFVGLKYAYLRSLQEWREYEQEHRAAD